MRAFLDTPERFDLRRTLASHGWGWLAPFRMADDFGWIDTVVAPGEGPARTVRIEAAEGGIVVSSPGRVDRAVRRELLATARRVLNLDLDLTPFWRAVEGDARTAWMAEVGAGRLLRAPTAWEDLVKLVLTTNCGWSSTTAMVERLVDRWGRPAPDGRKAFPSAAAVLEAGERRLRRDVRAGYRAPHLVALARAVAGGDVDPESWDRDPRPAVELRREFLALPGVGPYVAENLLKLLGRPCGLALDSWMRARYAHLHHGGRPVRDRTIARRVARLGDWGGLALWFELTADWLPDGDAGPGDGEPR